MGSYAAAVDAMNRTARNREAVPWRTIVSTVAVVLGTVIAIELVLHLQRVLTQLLIAGFLAAVLNPAVDALHRRRVPRGLATALVFLVGALVALALGYMFLSPIISELRRFADDLPHLVAQTQQGRGPIGHLVRRYHLEHQVQQRLPQIRRSLGHSGGTALHLLARLAAGVVGFLTILVLTFLILVEAPGMSRSALAAMSPARADRLRRVSADIGRSVSGYVAGNLATSLIAGAVCGVALLVMGVPFALVFAVWVGLVDLLPLVGGLLAGVPTVGFAFLHSVKAGIVLAIVFIVYQQLENHALNPLIMSRTVKLNPLWVLLSVLIGAELAGFVGALLAIPAAGAIQVITRDVWDRRRGLPTLVPTVGPEQRATSP